MYRLHGIVNNGDSTKPVSTEPFPKPPENADIYYDWGKEMRMYWACLVQVAEQTETKLSFYAINKQTEKPDTSKKHEVDLRDTDMVWPTAPSTNWHHTNSDNNCLVLLLEIETVKREPTLLAAAADDGGKWPRGSSDKMFKMQAELDLVRKRLLILRAFLEDKAADKGDPKEKFDSLFHDHLL